MAGKPGGLCTPGLMQPKKKAGCAPAFVFAGS